MAIQTKTMTVKSDTTLAETTTTIRDTVTLDTSKLPNGITYKGLKAVLSFADPIQWNRASTYDSLTVVWDDATHASYASKRPVPQDIDLTNEFYWLRTADLDAQVEMYRREVQEFDGRITANTQAIAAETARAEGAEQTLRGDIDEKIMVVIGDSFGNWEKTGTPYWHEYIKTALGFTRSIVKSSPGTGLFAPQTPNFRTQLQNAISDTSFNHDNVYAVFIQGGCNDYSSWQSNPKVYANEIKDLCGMAHNAFKHAEVHVIVTGWAYENQLPSAYGEGTATNSNHSEEYYYQLCEGSRGQADVINIANCLGIAPISFTQVNTLNDWHPSSEGSQWIARCILNQGKNPYWLQRVMPESMPLMFNFSDGKHDKILIENELHYDFLINGKYYTQGVIDVTLQSGVTNTAYIVPLNYDCKLPVKSFIRDYKQDIYGDIGVFNGAQYQDKSLVINFSNMHDILDQKKTLSWSMVFDLTGM